MEYGNNEKNTLKMTCVDYTIAPRAHHSSYPCLSIEISCLIMLKRHRETVTSFKPSSDEMVFENSTLTSNLKFFKFRNS